MERSAVPETTDWLERRSRPWERLPLKAADVMDRERDTIAAEIVERLGIEIPAYTRPLRGAFGEAVLGGVDQALKQFSAMVRDPATSMREEGRRVYQALGRGEMEAGRSIGALLAAYRIGAQVAWRRLADAGLEAGLDQSTLNLLAESIFAYIDALSAESAEGYALAQMDRAGELDSRRADLIDLTTRGTLGSEARALGEAAARAEWRVPQQLAVVVWREDLGRTPAGRLPQDSIVALLSSFFVALVPDPLDPARRGQLTRGFAHIASGLGSTAPPAGAPRSYTRALDALRLGEELGSEGMVAADDHRVELITRSDPTLIGEILNHHLAPLEDETPPSQERLRETLLAWLRNNGNVPDAADELHVHAQTVRYRMARLRELIGDALDDPDTRFELEFALRAR